MIDVPPFVVLILWMACIATVLWKVINWHTGGQAPSCFGSRPGPQQKAENGCHDCKCRGYCFEYGDRLDV